MKIWLIWNHGQNIDKIKNHVTDISQRKEIPEWQILPTKECILILFYCCRFSTAAVAKQFI